MKKYYLFILFLLVSTALYAQRYHITPEGAKRGLVVTIIIFSIVFGSALILYIKQRMDKE